MNNNKFKKKKIKNEIFQELKEYNEYLINQYLDYENNDEEYKKYIVSKKYFLEEKWSMMNLLELLKNSL